jgi:CHAT domain-containing protein
MSLTIREKTLGPHTADTARSLTALALAEKHLADFLPALEHAERAVTILRGLSLERHPQTADALTALASIQSDLGDLDAARASLEQALTIYERAYGPDHLRVGQVIGELGMLGQLAGDLPASLASYRRARDIYEAIDSDNDRVAGILNVEAALLAQMGRLREARDLAARSAANRERTFGPDHPALGWSLATLGRCLWLSGEEARAQTVLLRALAILGPSRGEDHPIYLAARYDLACVRRLRGADTEALDLALTVERGRRESVRATMSGLPERLALIYASRWPNGLDLAVDIATTGVAATPAVASVWEDLLKSRALVLDEMALRRRTVATSGGTAADSLQQALAAATRDLAGALVKSWQSDETTESDGSLLELRDRRDRIERRIAGLGPRRRVGAHAETISLADVAAALPSDAALVGFVRFERQPQPAADGSPAQPGPAYAAFVLPVGRREPVVIALGDAATIDNLVRAWRDEAGLGRRVPGRDVAAATAACRRVGTALRARIWDPLSPHLAGARRIYVVPDGPLHLVNLAALPSGDDRYLIDDDRPLVYLGAERDLLDAPATGGASGELLALGAPDFSANRTPIAFAPLPASADEVREVAALWRRTRRVAERDDAVRALLGRDASEAAFKTLAPGYRALHVATHGFFLDDGDTGPQTGQRGVGGLQSRHDAGSAADPGANPMLRSGLVLTGDAVGAGPGGEDGILTAAEIAALDLGNVGWVVLSACESGVGVIGAGEGVFGLRRAFRIAGARGLVISLWPLEDDRIRDWMLQLYGAHLTDRLELVPAAWRASRAVLASRRAAGLDTHPQTWAAFIPFGD